MRQLGRVSTHRAIVVHNCMVVADCWMQSAQHFAKSRLQQSSLGATVKTNYIGLVLIVVVGLMAIAGGVIYERLRAYELLKECQNKRAEIDRQGLPLAQHLPAECKELAAFKHLREQSAQ